MDMLSHLEATGPALFLIAIGGGVLVFFAAAVCAVRAVQTGRFGFLGASALAAIATVATLDDKLPLPPRWSGLLLVLIASFALFREAHGWDRLAPLVLVLFGGVVWAAF